MAAAFADKIFGVTHLDTDAVAEQQEVIEKFLTHEQVSSLAAFVAEARHLLCLHDGVELHAAHHFKWTTKHPCPLPGHAGKTETGVAIGVR